MLLRTRILVLVPSLTLALLVPASLQAQSLRTGSPFGTGSGVSGMPFGGLSNNNSFNTGAGSSTGLTRSQNTLANPVNYWQYSQITGTGPSIGTVATYNQFGLAGMAFGGALNSGTQGTPGGSPPPGVMLSVNNAQMMYPNQTQINNLGFNYPLNPNSFSPYSGMGYSPYGYPSPYAGAGYSPYGYPGYGMGAYPGLFGGLGTGLAAGQNGVQNQKPAGN